MAGLKGSMMNHDNWLVNGGDEGQHNRNMWAKRERAREKGATPKHPKSTSNAAETD